MLCNLGTQACWCPLPRLNPCSSASCTQPHLPPLLTLHTMRPLSLPTAGLHLRLRVGAAVRRGGCVHGVGAEEEQRHAVLAEHAALRLWRLLQLPQPGAQVRGLVGWLVRWSSGGPGGSCGWVWEAAASSLVCGGPVGVVLTSKPGHLQRGLPVQHLPCIASHPRSTSKLSLAPCPPAVRAAKRRLGAAGTCLRATVSSPGWLWPTWPSGAQPAGPVCAAAVEWPHSHALRCPAVG